MTNNEKLEILSYLRDKFNNLKIEVNGKKASNIMDLMYNLDLNGWCWQTTSTAILFMNKDSYIVRGYLTISEIQKDYFHSWITFNYKDNIYVFDPCLNKIQEKDVYYKVFKARVTGFVNQEMVYNYFINYIKSYKKKEYNGELDEGQTKPYYIFEKQKPSPENLGTFLLAFLNTDFKKK